MEKIDFSISNVLFQINVILNFSLQMNFWNKRTANLQTIMPTCFIVTKGQSCSLSVNNPKKHEHKGDVKRR